MNCPICNSSETNDSLTLSQSVTSDSQMIDENVTNAICKKCGNTFNESGSRGKIANFYRDSYKLLETTSEAEFMYYTEKGSISYSSLRLSILTKYENLSSDGNILDIGCGKGNFLYQFSKKFPKWTIHGVEASKSALEIARAKLPHAHFIEGLFDSNLFDQKFDLIVILGVLEHLEDPVSFLKSTISCLKDNGLIFFDVPNFKLNPVDLFVYDHLTHFTKEIVENLLTVCELDVLQIVESTTHLPLFCICRSSTKKRSIKNYYSVMNKLVREHTSFNDAILDTYQIADRYDRVGVFGLGIMIWVGIQQHKIAREKIVSFFDENNLLIGKTKSGIMIKSLNEISEFKDLPIILSLNPCYIDKVLRNLDQMKVIIPNKYSYYKKYL